MDDGIDPHIFFGLQKSHYDDRLTYVPKSALVVEVSKSRTGPPTVVATRLGPDELEDWLNKQITSDRLGTTSPGLRLILGNAREPETPGPWSMPPGEGGDSSWPGDYQGVVNMWPVPFSRSHFDVMINRFSLPQSTRWLCRTSTRHLQTYRMRPAAPGFPRYGLTFRAFQAVHVALSLSHDSSTGVTTALMLGQSGRQAEFVRAQVSRLARLAHHPALLPTLLVAAMRTAAAGAVEGQRAKMHATESAAAPGFPAANLLVLQSFRDVGRLCALWAAYVERTAEEAERLRGFVARLSGDVEAARAAAAASGGGAEKTAADKGWKQGGAAAGSRYSMADSDLDEIGLILDERLDFILHKSRLTVATAKYVKDRSMDSIPTTGYYTLSSIYHRLGLLGLLDTERLKTISVALMVFLPAILTTTLFSTSFMAGLNPPPWAFCAAAVPFVCGVLALWATWDRWDVPRWMRPWPRMEFARRMGDFKRWARRRIGLPDDTESATDSGTTSIVSDD